ncbi:MAG: hypothetical protein ACE5JS_15225 [Nitrospinota bacterium]
MVDSQDTHRIQQILSDYSIYRDHQAYFESSPKVYRYLLDRLPLASTLIRILDFGNYKVFENPDRTLTVDNQDGLVLKVWVHHKSDNQLISYVEGVYDSWWTPGIHGRAVIWLRFHPKKIEGHSVIENDMLGFIKFSNPVVDVIAKGVDFLVRRLTDLEIQKGQGAGRSIAELLAKDPLRVYAAMRESPQVSPAELEEFRRTFLLSDASEAVQPARPWGSGRAIHPTFCRYPNESPYEGSRPGLVPREEAEGDWNGRSPDF